MEDNSIAKKMIEDWIEHWACHCINNHFHAKNVNFTTNNNEMAARGMYKRKENYTNDK